MKVIDGGTERLSTRNRALLHWIYVVMAFLSLIGASYGVLSAAPRPLERQPFPDSYEYTDAAKSIAQGKGYVTFVDERTGLYDDQPRPPRYPPGLSLILAPFALAPGDPFANMQFASKLIAFSYVLITLAVTWRLGGPLAAAIAGIFVASSPFVSSMSTFILSDVLGALLTVLTFGLLWHPTSRRIVAGGFFSGYSVMTRLTGMINLAALLPVLSNRGRVMAISTSLPFLVILGLYDWATFGSPIRSGYDYWLSAVTAYTPSSLIYVPPADEGNTDGPAMVADRMNDRIMRIACNCPTGRSAQRALPNLVFYPAVLLGLFWIFTPPLATVPGIVYVWAHRREPGPRFAFWLTVLTLILLAFYFWQGARFLAPPASVLLICSSIALTVGWERLLLRMERRAALVRVT